jgi:hypothetical protein
MKNNKMQKVLTPLIIGALIIVSFLFHSSLFSPLLNSDSAVVVLMIYDFHLPQDLYYWGANRFGSLIPLIGQLFYKGLHFTPIASEAISHYLILIAGFWGFSGLFNTRLSKIVLAIVWFLPPFRMIDILILSQGEQYSLIGIVILLLNKYNDPSINKYPFG